MKKLLTVLLAITTLSVFGQKNQFVDLKWKIAKDEKLNYATVMNEISETVEVDFRGLFKALIDISEFETETKELFNKINQIFGMQDYVTTLINNGNGVVDIVMRKTVPQKQQEEIVEEIHAFVPEEEDISEDEMAFFFQELQSMFQESTVMLRGSVYETGDIHSFWVKNDQKNLIALFFELPTKPVKIGDKWSLNVNLIANDQSFECDSAYKINEITLSDIKTVNGETIAVLKYNIAEYVNGIFNAPAFFGNEEKQIETMMKLTYKGIAEFSIDKGRWITYDGIMSIDTTGVMIANKKTKFTLINETNTSR